MFMRGAARLLSLALVTAFVAAATPAWGQEITGEPGSPSATTTVDGSYLPNPPKQFGGEIGLSAADSKPYWAPQVTPPKGAPSVLLIMTDDQGYGVCGTFGGVVPTPAMDRVAKMGLRLRSSARPPSVRPRGRRSSPAVTITPWALA